MRGWRPTLNVCSGIPHRLEPDGRQHGCGISGLSCRPHCHLRPNLLASGSSFAQLRLGVRAFVIDVTLSTDMSTTIVCGNRPRDVEAGVVAAQTHARRRPPFGMHGARCARLQLGAGGRYCMAFRVLVDAFVAFLHTAPGEVCSL